MQMKTNTANYLQIIFQLEQQTRWQAGRRRVGSKCLQPLIALASRVLFGVHLSELWQRCQGTKMDVTPPAPNTQPPLRWLMQKILEIGLTHAHTARGMVQLIQSVSILPTRNPSAPPPPYPVLLQAKRGGNYWLIRLFLSLSNHWM